MTNGLLSLARKIITYILIIFVLTTSNSLII